MLNSDLEDLAGGFGLPELDARRALELGIDGEDLALGSSSASALALATDAMGSTVPKGTPPATRGTLPPSQSSNRIDVFNNPNKTSFPSATVSLPRAHRNWIGYRTYVQFMMDFGRDRTVVSGTYAPISKNSPLCPRHSESTDGGTFSFPVREQPTHAVRRALIAAINIVKQRNQSIPNLAQRDWVSVVTFDSTAGTTVLQSLTGNYDTAMSSCTDLQAAGDIGQTTATEQGLITAKNHLTPGTGSGRNQTNKVVVLLTDGMPNLYSSSNASIDSYLSANSNPDWYGGGYYWMDAPLMQTKMMQGQNWQTFPVGVGLGCDYNFMDRIARTGQTANENNQSPRGSGNPAEYEQRLKTIFQQIIDSPRVRLVQ